MAMDRGVVATTSLSNQEDAEEVFSKLVAQGKDVVHITISSGLSGSYNTAMMAAKAVNATSKNKVYVVDSLTASGGLGILVLMANEYAQSGKSAKEVYDYAESIKMNICAFFCLSTVRHVIRGGRVARVAALLASAINIKLFLHCDNNGKLIVIHKTFSRKKTLQYIIDSTIAKYNGMSDMMHICHAISPEDAQFVADGVFEGTGVMPKIMPLGPVIGSHGGKGALSIFFTGVDRLKV